MPEARRAPRHAAKQRGSAVVSGRAEIPCVIRDLSATGARLSFSNPTILPRTFRLEFDHEEHRVTVVWQRGLMAGVRFQSPIAVIPTQKRRTWPWGQR